MGAGGYHIFKLLWKYQSLDPFRMILARQLFALSTTRIGSNASVRGVS